MATIKSYSDLEQSKKLAKILPLESVDAFYIIGKEPVDIVVIYGFVTHKHLKEQIAYKRAVPCWSLASLLSVLPNENMLVKTTDCEYYCLAKDVMTKHYDNPVDACVEMIIKLHEMNLL